jgi:hypothetical protein
MQPFLKATPWFIALFIAINCPGQDETRAGRVTPKELSIPAAPIFDLMGVTPSQITRTSDIKDFKVDWSFKSWRLNPNLAIQSQPVWELFYNRKDLSKYQGASRFMRRLASLDISIGTVQNEDEDRRIGGAAKLNLLKGADPLLAKELYTDISEKYRAEKTDLENQVRELENTLDSTTDIMKKPALRAQIKSTEDQLLSINSRRNAEINERAAIFVAENWNASWLDIAAGKVNTFATDSAGSLLKLRLNRNTAWSFWLNGGFPLGKRMLVSALVRTSVYEEQVDFLLRDKTSGEEAVQQAVADNELWSLGLNVRYGGSIYTFFAEFLYERRGLKTPLEALNEVFKLSDNNQEIVSSSVKWTTLHPFTINFGGDWRISRNVILNYGMRCIFDDNWKFQTFIPVATISCMMR